jgi:frataxin-like iron-binding protein CyaY
MLKKEVLLMKYLICLLLLSISLFIISCEGTTEPEPIPETGSIIITSTPDSAEIWINNVYSGKVTPDTISELKVGKVNISVRKAGYASKETSIDILKDQIPNINFTLIAESGGLKVNSTPSYAGVWVNNVFYGLTPASIMGLKTGAASISIRKEGYDRLDTTISIIKDVELNLDFTLIRNTGSIIVASNPSAAEIWINNINSGKVTPDTLREMKLGAASVSIRKYGYHRVDTVVSIIKNVDLNLNFNLSSNSGGLIITSDPSEAQIWINNIFTGKLTPNIIEGIEVGLTPLSLRKYGHQPIDTIVNIKKDVYLDIIFKLKPVRGDLTISSSPSDAQIWINNVFTNKVTPNTIRDLPVGIANISIRKSGYNNHDFPVNINKDRDFFYHVVLTRDIDTVVFGIVRLWETVGTTMNQPAGLDLSTGVAGVVTAGHPAAANNDIYYSTNGFVLRSADNANGRRTTFLVGGGTYLFDGVPSPLSTNQWIDKIPDYQHNYVFLFDQDGHYSKLRIVNRGGGTPGYPAWIEVQWIYNKRPNDRNF